MGPVGVQEMVVIFLVALVLFGPKKLPELGRTLGKALTEFRRAQSELKATLEHHMNELERENESLKEVTRGVNNEIYSHYESPVVEPYESGPYTPDEAPSAASHPSTTSATATEGAEPAVSYESASGNVPRTSQAGYPAAPAAHAPSTESLPAEPDASRA